jgi:hypothetical protein
MEQRGTVKFCVTLQKCPRATLVVYKTVYGESAMSMNNVCMCGTNVSGKTNNM